MNSPEPMTQERIEAIVNAAFDEWLAANPPDSSAREHYERTCKALKADLVGMVRDAKAKSSLAGLIEMAKGGEP